jgi:hypothetical protein
MFIKQVMQNETGRMLGPIYRAFEILQFRNLYIWEKLHMKVYSLLPPLWYVEAQLMQGCMPINYFQFLRPANGTASRVYARTTLSSSFTERTEKEFSPVQYTWGRRNGGVALLLGRLFMKSPIQQLFFFFYIHTVLHARCTLFSALASVNSDLTTEEPQSCHIHTN